MSVQPQEPMRSIEPWEGRPQSPELPITKARTPRLPQEDQYIG